VVLLASNRSYDAWRAASFGVACEDLRAIAFASQMDYLGWKEKIRFALLRNVQQGHWLPWFRNHKEAGKGRPHLLHFKTLLSRGLTVPPLHVADVGDVAAVAYTYGTSGTALPVPLTHRNLASNALQLRHWLPESRPGDE